MKINPCIRPPTKKINVEPLPKQHEKEPPFMPPSVVYVNTIQEKEVKKTPWLMIALAFTLGYIVKK